ncbi:MAG: ATP-binding protein [Chloroflexota bacterium]
MCIRVGPRRGFATDHEERVLIERWISHALTFDALPCLGSSLADIGVPLFLLEYRPQAIAPEVIEENNRPVQQQLASLRFFDTRHGCATNAGIVLFGISPRDWLPGAYIQSLRVGGDSLSAPVLNEKEIGGDLLSMLRELDALIDAQLTQIPVPETTLRERTVAAYPRVAIRELLMNAVMHRDYASTAPLRFTWLEDRIEIQSPGSLYGEATPENFPRQTSYRNPVIAEALKNLGYVNRYGRGVLRSQEALERNGSPHAEFEFDAGFVLATIRRHA